MFLDDLALGGEPVVELGVSAAALEVQFVGTASDFLVELVSFVTGSFARPCTGPEWTMC